MRNLKRALSLVLAVVMVIGLMVVGASAVSYNDFSDRGEIVNKDAVSMLTTLEIIEGLPDGSYDPTGDVDRAMMAKMISVALTNNEDCDTLYTNVNSGLTDISANWARGYINYCYVRGIIAGRGDNTFDPGANVTGVEAAKMLLAALGYNAEIEGLVGPDWALNTAALAQQLGIFRNFTKDVSEPLNRDDAALLIYNALDVEMIQQYQNGYALVYADHRTILSSVFGVIRVEGVVAANEWAQLQETDSDAALREGRTTLEDVIWYDSTTANTTVAEGVRETQPVTFNVATPVDMIGKAVTMYVEKTTILSNSTVIGIATNDDMNVINTTVESEDTVRDFLDGTGVTVDEDTAYYVNYGYCDNAEEAVATINDYANTVYGTTNTNFALNGIEVEVIDNNDDGMAEYVLYTMETLSQVNRYSERDETLTFYVPDRVNGRLDLTASPATRDLADVVFADGVTVDTDDLILYVEYGGRTYVSLPEIVTGTMTRVDRDRDDQLYITVDDGETYYQSYIPDAASMVDVDMDHFDIDDARDIPGFDTVYDFILDSNGFVVAVRPAEEVETNYALVLDSAWTQNALTRSGEVKILRADATEATYTINWNASADAFDSITNIHGTTYPTTTGTGSDDKLEAYLGTRDVQHSGTYETGTAKGSIITYSLNDDNVLTIESVLQGNSLMKDADANDINESATSPDETLEIQDINETTTAGVSDNGEVIFLDTTAYGSSDNCNVQYEVTSSDGHGYTNGSGRITLDSTDPDYAGNSITYAVDRNTVAFYYYTTRENGKDTVKYGVATGWNNMSNVADGVHAQVYPVLDKDTNRTYTASKLADVIIFEAEPQTTTANYMLVLDANAKTKDLWELTVVFEDGTVSAINVDEDDLGDFDPDVNGDFMRAYTYVENSDGTYTVGSTGNNVTFKGTADLLQNGTIDYNDLDSASNDGYWAIHDDALIWDVSDVDTASDNAVAGSFNNVVVNTVIVVENNGIRTAWIWAIPGATTPPTLSGDIQVRHASEGIYDDVTFYVENGTAITARQALNALLAEMADDGCTDINVMQWGGTTNISYRYGSYTRYLSVDMSIDPNAGAGTEPTAPDIELAQVYKLTVDGKMLGYYEVGATLPAAVNNGMYYFETGSTTPKTVSALIASGMERRDLSIEIGYQRFHVDPTSNMTTKPATMTMTVDTTGIAVLANTENLTYTGTFYYAKPGTELTITLTGAVRTDDSAAGTITAGESGAYPAESRVIEIEDPGTVDASLSADDDAVITETTADQVVSFSQASTSGTIDYEEFVITVTWTLDNNACVPTLSFTGLNATP